MLESKHVVLVNENDEELGICDKLTVHHEKTPLHRGFSAFLFNKNKKLLLQKRHASKKTWPNFWSNSFCGHPQQDETYEDAVHRHAQFELNMKLTRVIVLKQYRYSFSYNNIMENEICPVFLVFSDSQPTPHPTEISAIKWMQWDDFLQELNRNTEQFSPWCKEEVELIKMHPELKKII